MNLQARATAIITKPASEWQVIAAEPTDVASLFTSYIMILAAIPAICTFVVVGFIGGVFAGGLGVTAAFTLAIASYVRALVGIFIAAIVIEKLAPQFDSRGDTAQALKLVAYSYTPVWIASLLVLTVILSPLVVIAALYAIYLFYLGTEPVMKTPKDKVIVYMIVSAVVIICVNIVLGLVLGAVMPYRSPFWF